MSRYMKDLRSGGTVAYGYDPPLATYFYQILDKNGDILVDKNCSGIEMAGAIIVLLGENDVDADTTEHVQLASMDLQF